MADRSGEVIALPTAAQCVVVQTPRRGRLPACVTKLSAVRDRRDGRVAPGLIFRKLKVEGVFAYSGSAETLHADVLKRLGTTWPRWPLTLPMEWRVGNVELMLSESALDGTRGHWTLFLTKY